MTNSDSVLMIFTRAPQLGVGKRRLAATVGDEAALAIYKKLLAHTKAITEPLDVDIQVWYSDEVPESDIWSTDRFSKHAQQGEDLGDRMGYAFAKANITAYKKSIIIGSDLYDLSTDDLAKAFKALNDHDHVIGPAEDGGYYLLGTRAKLPEGIFKNKEWGTPSVLDGTLRDLEGTDYFKLPERNDVDYYEDIAGHPDFEPYLKHIHAK